MVRAGLVLFSTMLPTEKGAVFGMFAQIDAVGQIHKYYWLERLIHCSNDVA
ncbi:hypothetical protein [Candidatus Coxiella mudrowiae]|uniref:hypothetical protein n=1 Tax=Candidatus Coxiella mudrowiae TaxID=2054173 RepID=UPI001FD30CE0|nr:hypothetical protein [Candidatus Coxiella mudrowiae]